MKPIASIHDPKERLVAFVKERQRIYEVRLAGAPKPWTTDPILQRFRFSNMLRENDVVTKWIADNWRTPNVNHPDLWFAIVVARLVNEPLTLTEMGFPLRQGLTQNNWNRGHFERTIRRRKAAGLRTYNPAYMVPACSTVAPKVELNLRVLDDLWASRKTLRPKEGDTLRSWHILVGQFWGIGSFIVAQVIADLKYASGTPLERAKDWMTFAASGPGSRRGMCRLEGRPVSEWKRDSEDVWWQKLIRLRNEIMPLLKGTALYEAHAQDFQSFLCEWDKWERARLGEGFPKQKYNGQS